MWKTRAGVWRRQNKSFWSAVFSFQQMYSNKIFKKISETRQQWVLDCVSSGNKTYIKLCVRLCVADAGDSQAARKPAAPAWSLKQLRPLLWASRYCIYHSKQGSLQWYCNFYNRFSSQPHQGRHQGVGSCPPPPTALILCIQCRFFVCAAAFMVSRALLLLSPQVLSLTKFN